MSFASPSDFLARFDARTVGDMVEDLGANVPAASLLTDPNLQACLDDAAGDIVAAAVSNQHYATQDLVNIAGSGTMSANLLKRINCVLALYHLLSRRIYNQDEIKRRVPEFDWANDYLEKLKNGQRVFEIPVPNVQAGVMQTTPLGAHLTAPDGSGIVYLGHVHRAFGHLRTHQR